MIYTVTVTSQGQISIPAAVRRRFSLEKGKKAILEVEEDKIILTPQKDILELRGILKTDKKIPFKKVREAFGDYLSKRHLE